MILLPDRPPTSGRAIRGMWPVMSAAIACLMLFQFVAGPARGAAEIGTAPGSANAGPDDARHGSRPGIVVQRRAMASPGGTLTVDLATGGELSVSGWDRDEVWLEAELGGRDSAGTRVELRETSGGSVRFSAHQTSRGPYSTSHRFVLRVPRRYSVEIASAGGSMRLTGLSGRFAGHTNGGELVLANLEGEAQLATRGGPISVSDSNLGGLVSTNGGGVTFDNVRGALRAAANGEAMPRAGGTGTAAGAEPILEISQAGGNIDIETAERGARLVTGGGNIRLGSAHDFVDAQTGGGDIVLVSVDGDVSAVTGSGAATVALNAPRTAGVNDVRITSGSGPVTVVLAPGVGAEFDVETGHTAAHGQPVRVLSNLPLQISEGSGFEAVERGTPRRYVRANGRAGEVRYRIRIRTVNGDVRIIGKDR